ncbi:glycosyltransferase family 2 protein [Butyrivibrio sp. VCD2006]|uniref:glycosyltransferase family 2 protein n=1 Tax=Butyrivibrio sp. VCD2006 TaxID=1280664 RepID=UPI000400ECE3|nr:glycosyltransferase family 2 protein [Butyrivibrio sp. VCD2006]
MDYSKYITILNETIQAAWRMIWYAQNNYQKYSSWWIRRTFSMIKNHISEIYTIAHSLNENCPNVSTLISGIELINTALSANNYEISSSCMESVIIPVITSYKSILEAHSSNNQCLFTEDRTSVEGKLSSFTAKLKESTISPSQKILSVIIPCYNAQNYINGILSDLCNQTIGINPLEIILVDDASTDDTLEVITSWKNDYPENISVIHLDENGRQGRARNIAVKKATTEYVLFLDADDSVTEDLCEVTLEIAETTNVEVVSVDLISHNMDGTYSDPEGYNGETEHIALVQGIEDRIKLWHEGLRGSTISKLYRKSIFEMYDISYPEKKLYEDNYFAVLTTLSIHSYYILDNVCYIWNMHESSSSHRMNNLSHFDRVDVLDLLLRELKKRGIYYELKSELDKWFLDIYFFATLHIAFTRFNPVPYDKMNEFTARFCKQFPDIRSSSLYSSLEYKYQRDFIDFAFYKLSNEDWDSLQSQYLSIIDK